MATKTEIANLALARLGTEATVQNVDTEESDEAGYLRTFFDSARRATLRSHAWRFATSYRTLVEVSGDVTSRRWSYKYKYPNDIIRFVELEKANRNDDEIPFETAYDASSKEQIILTNEPPDTAVGVVIEDIQDPTEFDDSFADALGWRLAFEVAPNIAGNNAATVHQTMFQFFQQAIEEAKAMSSRESQHGKDPDADWIKDR
jgi:hypothetical protein